MSQRIEIKGLDKLIKKFDRLGKDMGKAILDMSYKGALYAHSQIPSYPPPRAGSFYRRSGTMGRTTTAKARKVSDREYEGLLGNPTEYSPWVISEDRGLNNTGGQAWFHQNVWYTLQAVVRKARTGIIRIYRAEIKRLLEK